MTTTCPFCGAPPMPHQTQWFTCDTIIGRLTNRADQTQQCVEAEVARLTRERDEARAEITRLKAGGCAEAVVLQERVKRLEEFANRFLHPEDLGFTVTAWIRDDAREALGMPAVETKAKEVKP